MPSSRRFWFRLHSFTGVVTGLLLFVICWSGTFAVVSHEIDWLVTPDLRVDVGDERRSVGAVYAAVQAAFPDGTVDSVRSPLYTRSAAEVVVNLAHQDSIRVSVNPYTAEVLGAGSYFTVQRFFRSFHMNLFLPEIGLYVVSVFAVTMMVSLIAALVFYKRWWRRFLAWPRGDGAAYWSGLHKVAGLWSIWFVVVIALTGLWYLYEVAQGDLIGGPVNYVGDAPYGVVQVPAPGSDPSLSKLPFDDVIAKAQAAWPAFDIRNVGWGYFSGSAETLYLEGQSSFPLVRDRANQMHLDPRTGDILWWNSAYDLPVYWVVSNMADPLHFGDFGGLWSKLVWFVFGLILSGLILTGAWLHVRRLAKGAGADARHRWPGTLGAMFVIVGVLVVSVPFGLAEARDYGPMVNGIRQFPDIAPGVLAVIFSWIVVTVIIITAWGYLLWRPETVRSALNKAAKKNNRAH